MNLSIQSFDRPTISSRDLLRVRMQAEFLELPGLTLSLDQAARLFGIDTVSCQDALTEFVDCGFLTLSDGCFRRAAF